MSTQLTNVLHLAQKPLHNMLHAIHALLLFFLSIPRLILNQVVGFFSTKSEGERISLLDAIWLEMSDENTSVVINAVLQLQDSVSRDQVIKLIKQKLLKYKKFRCAIDQPPSSNRLWEALVGKPRPILREVEFDDKYHVTHHIVAEDQSYEQGLQRLVNEIGCEQLDYSKPLWRLHVLDSEDKSRGSAVLIQIHHSIGDGMSLVRLLFSLTTEEADGETTPSLKLLHGGGKRQQPSGVKKAGSANILQKCLFFIGLFFWVLIQVFTALKKLLVCPPDTRTVLKGPLGPEKQMSYIDLDLNEVKAISKAQNCTINDVLVSVVSASLREYLCTQQQPGLKQGTSQTSFNIDKVSMHAVIPFSLRPWSEEIVLDNSFSMLFLPMPINESDPIKRTQKISQAMMSIKTSLEPYVNYYACQLLFIGPIQRYLCPLFSYFSDKASLILTNVPGPQQPLYFAGSRIDMLRFFVPQGAKLSLGVSIFSYAGKVSIGISADKGVVKDSELIGQYCVEQFDQLKMACDL